MYEMSDGWTFGRSVGRLPGDVSRGRGGAGTTTRWRTRDGCAAREDDLRRGDGEVVRRTRSREGREARRRDAVDGTDSFTHSLARSLTHSLARSFFHSFNRTVDGECGRRAGGRTRGWEEERAEDEDESAREAREGRG